VVIILKVVDPLSEDMCLEGREGVEVPERVDKVEVDGGSIETVGLVEV
jgi:hypothetical protein